jgi:hypothetical protein
LKKIKALALVLALWGLLCACASTENGSESISAEPDSSASVEQVVEPEYIVYPGFLDQTITAKSPYLELPNSYQNTVDFLFVVTNKKGEELFVSDPVAPGERAKWDVTERWSKSKKRTVYITATPVLEDGTTGNSSTQSIVLDIDLSSAESK